MRLSEYLDTEWSSKTVKNGLGKPLSGVVDTKLGITVTQFFRICPAANFGFLGRESTGGVFRSLLGPGFGEVFAEFGQKAVTVPIRNK